MKRQRLYEKYLKKEIIYKQYKTRFEYLIKKLKKNFYSHLIDSCNYNIKRMQDAMKEIIGIKRFIIVSLSNFITVKNKKIFNEKKLRKILTIILSISILKTFQNYIHYDQYCLIITNLTKRSRKVNNFQVTNYRQISVLSCFSNLLEHIMCNRLYKVLVENNMLQQK